MQPWYSPLGWSVLLALAVDAAAADGPDVQFDVNYLIECRDVTTDEFAALNPDESLLEATFQVSSLVERRAANDLIQYFYLIETPRRSLRIVDYQPRTTLESDIVGSVTVEKKDERSRSAGLSAAGKLDHWITGTAAADAGSKSTESVKYERLPPLDLVAASGTVKRGYGVYFKLKPSSRTSLEGSRDFVLALRVPRNWRADYVFLRCRAFCHSRSIVRPLGESASCGERSFVVALFRAGDEHAKRAAEQYVRSEGRLRDAAVEHRRDIYKRAYPTIAHQLAGALDVLSPRIPAGWMEQLIYEADDTASNRLAERLPAPVRMAALDYTAARHELEQLSGRTSK